MANLGSLASIAGSGSMDKPNDLHLITGAELSTVLAMKDLDRVRGILARVRQRGYCFEWVAELFDRAMASNNDELSRKALVVLEAIQQQGSLDGI